MTGVSEDAARVIVLERQQKPFSDLEDFYARVRLPIDTLRALAKLGYSVLWFAPRCAVVARHAGENSKLPRGDAPQKLLV